ncbi:mitochondrial import inner membrane translocase subunit-like [Raphidocelis subcapitata]|uniref:Mitochondrial import inner membrane translocase subunit Tim21 n=1 Tax=Raphidocelis subcapitata TaxID=307507 RepID=A0A2V0PBS5_9CHLO|nr:mitochondrial import inner membrane translocase subunit-like [Raphidocelis subcapitata]|eukprot:GBF97296.1 mitochondrial import inner membrane translocase subunit-like [Raphidocelis subcapitata]
MSAALRSRLLLQRAFLCASRGGSQHVAARHVGCSAAVGALQLGAAGFGERWASNADLLLPLPLGVAARFLASAQQQPQQQQKDGKDEPFDSLELTDEKINAITDKIPQRPVGVVEGTSYSAVILAAFGCLAYFVYNLVVTLVLEPVQQQCFNAALERLRTDPRITVRLGSAITGYGQDTANRSARHVIPHQTYKDAEGREHVRLQFHLRGPGGSALVSADMYRGERGEWAYSYLVADVASGGAPPQRLNIIV